MASALPSTLHKTDYKYARAVLSAAVCGSQASWHTHLSTRLVRACSLYDTEGDRSVLRVSFPTRKSGHRLLAVGGRGDAGLYEAA